MPKCKTCCKDLNKTEFSNSQLSRRSSDRRCMDCVEASIKDAAVSSRQSSATPASSSSSSSSSSLSSSSSSNDDSSTPVAKIASNNSDSDQDTENGSDKIFEDELEIEDVYDVCKFARQLESSESGVLLEIGEKHLRIANYGLLENKNVAFVFAFGLGMDLNKHYSDNTSLLRQNCNYLMIRCHRYYVKVMGTQVIVNRYNKLIEEYTKWAEEESSDSSDKKNPAYLKRLLLKYKEIGADGTIDTVSGQENFGKVCDRTMM